MNHIAISAFMGWLGGLVVEHWTTMLDVVGSIPAPDMENILS